MKLHLCMNLTPYTVVSIENLLFGSGNLTDENNLIVFRNVQKYISTIIDLNDMNKGNNKITELRTILQRESQNS